MNYIWHLCFILCVYAMLSLSLDILVGHLGLLVLCQSAFFALGAYIYAIMILRFGLPVAVAVASGIIGGATVSVAIALIARRLRGDAVVLASFAFLLLLGDILKNCRNITGGLDGLAGIPSILGANPQFFSIRNQSILALVLLAISYALVFAMTQGPYSRFLHALRDDVKVAVGLRIQPATIYIRSFAIAGAIAGLSGILYANYASYINPNIFAMDTSILIMAMVLVGGAGTRFGPILGAVILLAVPEAVRIAGGGIDTIGSVNYITMGIVLIVFAILRPRGIFGGYEFQ